MQRTIGTTLFLLLIGIAPFGQSSFRGLKPGQSNRTDVEKVFGRALRNVSQTLSEYRAAKKEELIFVQYRSDTGVIERIELVYPETLFRPDVMKMLNLPEPPLTTQINAKKRLEEYYGSPWFIALTYGEGPQALRVNRIGYYSRELFESATENLPRDQPRYKVPDPQARSGGEPRESLLGPDRDGWGFNPQVATVLTYFGSTSAAACRSDCEKNPKCMAYSWIRPNGILAGDPPMCYLMSAWIKMVQHPCCISAVRNPQ